MRKHDAGNLAVPGDGGGDHVMSRRGHAEAQKGKNSSAHHRLQYISPVTFRGPLLSEARYFRSRWQSIGLMA